MDSQMPRQTMGDTQENAQIYNAGASNAPTGRSNVDTYTGQAGEVTVHPQAPATPTGQASGDTVRPQATPMQEIEILVEDKLIDIAVRSLWNDVLDRFGKERGKGGIQKYKVLFYNLSALFAETLNYRTDMDDVTFLKITSAGQNRLTECELGMRMPSINNEINVLPEAAIIKRACEELVAERDVIIDRIMALANKWQEEIEPFLKMKENLKRRPTFEEYINQILIFRFEEVCRRKKIPHGLSIVEFHALKRWTTKRHITIGKALHETTVDNKSLVFQECAVLKHALAICPKYRLEEGKKLTRIDFYEFKDEKAWKKKYVENGQVTLESFKSTSRTDLSPTNVPGHEHHHGYLKFEIKSNQGVDVSPYFARDSYAKAQKEILLDIGLKFRVVKVGGEQQYNDASGKQWKYVKIVLEDWNIS